MGEFIDFYQKVHDEQEEEEYKEKEEEEEALSLCDFPLDNQKESPSPRISCQKRRSSSSPTPEPSEFFEFLSDFTTEMCSADDIIVCGKLLPLNEHSLSPPTQNPITHSKQDRQQRFFRRRSDSFSGLHTSSSITGSNSTAKTKFMMRNSRSLDYRKLQRLSSSTSSTSEPSSIDRNSSLKSVGKGENPAKKMAKPRWYVLMFGVVKPPAGMELSDIKSRQVRRNPPTMFPSADSSKNNPPVNRSPDKGSSRLLRLLSCRDYTSVAVATTPFYVPQV